MRFIDTHCHLFWDAFDQDLDSVVGSARQAGIDRIIIPATSVDTYHTAARIASLYEEVYTAVGIHPHDTSGFNADMYSEVAAHLTDSKVVAIGEIGLDYFYDFSPKEKQQEAFHAQLELAREAGLPVIIHNRDSDEDVLAICREHQDGTLKGQFHCFSSSAEYAERVLDAGFHISFTGNVTFKMTDLDAPLARVPDDRLLIETDSPFMTPAPHRKIRRNEPHFIPIIAEYYAAIRGTTVEHIAEITTRNAERLFGLAPLNTTEEKNDA